jgi:YVTN family beta-propeller protein
MKNNRLFLVTTALAFLLMACENDDNDSMLPGVGISVENDAANEDAGSISVSISSTQAFSSDVEVVYEVSGTAEAGTDYTALTGTVTLPAGQTNITQNVTIIDDDEVEQEETLIISLKSVDGTTDYISADDSVTLIISDNDSFPYENGILVLHEGNFFGGNASVSFVTQDLSVSSAGIFNTANEKALGDVAQSMAFNGDLAYIVVNNSQKVEVVNRYTFETKATIDEGFLNPRYMTFANGKGYVTNWGDGSDAGDDYIAVVNLEDNSVEATIPVPEGPEWILAKENSIYVAHQGGFNQNNIISVIDATSNTVTASVTVADRPNSMQLVNDDLWVLSGGNPAWTGSETAGQLDKIDTTTNDVTTTIAFGTTEHPSYLSVDGDVLYYLLNGNVYKFGSSDAVLPADAEISGLNFYDMTVNDGRLYGVDAKDFASNGSLEVYDLSTNALLGSIEVSIIPGGVYFNGAFEF